MKMHFMQRAFVGLALLAPMCAAMGVQVVNHRMAFFSDAISHSIFAGVAIGMLLAVDPNVTIIMFALAAGLGIVAIARRGKLSTDAIIGVFLSAAVAFGLAVVSKTPSIAGNFRKYLFGDILTIDERQIAFMAGLFVVLFAFQIFGYNRMLYVGLNPALAAGHGVRVRFYQYSFAAMLGLVAVCSIWAVGVLLVTAMLVVPASAARNLARSAGGMFWWSILIGLSSSISGLLISAQPWAATASGPTIILVAVGWFVVSMVVSGVRGRFAR
ncbi:MAG: metal ABC transporter permease [Planctomycetes bacterium]|nr:metal ABC transporter permease [Planctomycetota bacterium]